MREEKEKKPTMQKTAEGEEHAVLHQRSGSFPTKLWIPLEGGQGSIEIQANAPTDTFSLLRKAKETLEQASHYEDRSAPKQPELAPCAQELKSSDFVRSLQLCSRPTLDVNRMGLVGVEDCVTKCVQHVEGSLAPGAGQRVRPLILSRCARGGKTTILCRLFDDLKIRGHNPVFVSFNGDFNIFRLKRERKSIETLTRAIAISVMKRRPEDPGAVQCSEDVLRDYFQREGKVVLLIDELNVLLSPGTGEDHREVGTFLRSQFLDRKDRFLVFSTHISRAAGIDQLLGQGIGSEREGIFISMPESNNLTELKDMDDQCESLTDGLMHCCSGIPSLIYTLLVTKGINFQQRFSRLLGKPRKVKKAFIRNFLNEFFTGRLGDDKSLRAFDSFTQYGPLRGCKDDTPVVRWILAYVGQLCTWIADFPNPDYKVFHQVAALIEALKVHQADEESGRAWELLTQIAICLRCLHAMFSKEVNELLGLGDLPVSAVYTCSFSGKTVKDAKHRWGEICRNDEKQHSPTKRYPHVVLMTPTNLNLLELDTVLIHMQAAIEMRVVGFQNKRGRQNPRKNHTKEVDVGIWLRGDATTTAGPTTTNWVIPCREDIIKFLGSSLQDSYPYPTTSAG